MKHSTPQSRTADRDYWNSPSVIARCKTLDRATLYFIMAAVMILGSINL